MNKLIIKVKSLNLMILKSKTVKSKNIFYFENNLDKNIGLFNLKAKLKNNVLEGKIYLNDQEIEVFYLTDKSNYTFVPNLCDIMIEYNFHFKTK